MFTLPRSKLFSSVGTSTSFDYLFKADFSLITYFFPRFNSQINTVTNLPVNRMHVCYKSSNISSDYPHVDLCRVCIKLAGSWLVQKQPQQSRDNVIMHVVYT
jgi:hypothetical protein